MLLGIYLWQRRSSRFCMTCRRAPSSAVSTSSGLSLSRITLVITCPTTGNQDPIEEKEALSRNKLQENGISSPCRSRSYVDHELLTNCLHVAHNGGCAVLFKKDTFLLYIKVKSINLLDTRRELPDEVMEGDSGWVFQGVLSHVSFRRRPLNGQKLIHSCVVAHQVHYAKERGIGKKLILTIRAVMLDEKVDLVAGDFNSPAWRSSNRNNISTIEEAFADCALQGASRPHTVMGSWSSSRWVGGRWWVPQPLDSDGWWTVRQHDAFSIRHEALGIRPTDQSCITRPGSTLTLLNGAANKHTTKERSKDPLERTLCAVPLRQTEGTHQRRYERAFAFFVISRPFAHVRWALPTTWATRVSSPSDLMTLPVPISTVPCVSFYPSLLIIHIACMTIWTRRTTQKKRWRCGCVRPSSFSPCVFWCLDSSCSVPLEPGAPTWCETGCCRSRCMRWTTFSTGLASRKCLYDTHVDWLFCSNKAFDSDRGLRIVDLTYGHSEQENDGNNAVMRNWHKENTHRALWGVVRVGSEMLRESSDTFFTRKGFRTLPWKSYIEFNVKIRWVWPLRSGTMLTFCVKPTAPVGHKVSCDMHQTVGWIARRSRGRAFLACVAEKDYFRWRRGVRPITWDEKREAMTNSKALRISEKQEGQCALGLRWVSESTERKSDVKCIRVDAECCINIYIYECDNEIVSMPFS